MFSLTISVCVVSAYFFYFPLPQRSGSLKLDGLSKNVNVIYDKNGIPYIKADSEQDAFYTLGYIAGQHRLFQMDIHRRVATGRLSEILGEKLVPLDKLNRSMGFRYYAEKAVIAGKWSETTEKRLSSYLAGLNHFVETARVPVEFKSLGYQPEKFSKVDIIAFIGYMSFTFQEAFRQDPYLLNLNGKLSQEHIKQMIHSYEDDGPSIDKSFVKDLTASNDHFSSNIMATEKLKQALNLNDQWGLQLKGSNAWVVAPEKSESGKTLIANDPHISHSNPGVWFEASLEYPGKRFYGHFLSYVPFPILGWGPERSWNLTMSELDDMDFFAITKSSMQKEEENKKLSIKTVAEDIFVKGGAVVGHQVNFSAYGPFLDDYIKMNENVHIAGAWTFYSSQNQILEGLSLMYDSKDINTFKSAISKMTAPGLSISYGDIHGNIAWFTLGNTFKRSPNHNGVDIRLAGLEGPPELVPFKENPHLINPPDSYIITANHRLSNAKKNKFPGYYQPSDRARRIEKLINSKKKLSEEDYRQFLMDAKDEFFPQAKSLFLLSMENIIDEISFDLMEELKNSPAAGNLTNRTVTVYRVWSRILAKELFEDEWGEENFKKLFKSPIRYNLFKKVILDPNSIWWDKIATPEKETHHDILASVAQKTLQFLKTKLGEDQSKWSWGNLHHWEVVHPLGRAKPLNYLFNLGPVPMEGGYSMVNAQAARDAWDDYSVKSGPSTRRVINYAHPTWSLSILPTGNSGHRFDKFHKNQMQDYLTGKLQIRKLSYQYVNDSEKDSEILFLAQ